jgi:hypothetical protein
MRTILGQGYAIAWLEQGAAPMKCLLGRLLGRVQGTVCVSDAAVHVLVVVFVTLLWRCCVWAVGLQRYLTVLLRSMLDRGKVCK